MRRYQKWLSVGLLTLTPHIALADELDSPAGQVSPAAASAQKKSSANQQLAEQVAKSLRKAKLNQYEIDIDVRSGVVTLLGKIGKPEQKSAAEKAVSSVPGVTRVINRLEVAGAYQKGAVQQAVANMPRSPVGSQSQYIRQMSNRPAYGGIEPGPIGGQPMPSPEPARVAYAGAAPAQLAPVPQPAPGGAYPVSMGGHAVYNQPNLPETAWPTYAQHPNYAAVTYPSQYSASAWPYIGPFYPYPQVPLGWRKASLEWDDGYWNLNFRSRTDRWWWFLNPQNW
jgi:hypothetical protein